jgi:hypothetical protein
MNVGSKTLLPPFLMGSAFGSLVSVMSTNRSGALRLREGRLLGGSGGGVAFFVAGFFGAGFVIVFFGAGFAFAFALDELAAFLEGGEPSSSSSSSSSRIRFDVGCGVRFFAMLDSDVLT